MNLEVFQRQVGEFAREIKDLLDTCLPNETLFENPIISSDNLRASFTATKPLDINGSDRASMTCSFRLCTNTSGRHLAVETSSFALNYRANDRPVPVVRFEYERNARAKPVSHFHFHADSVPLGLMLARGGNHRRAAQLEEQDLNPLLPAK